jgi:hypothetical protein
VDSLYVKRIVIDDLVGYVYVVRVDLCMCKQFFVTPQIRPVII